MENWFETNWKWLMAAVFVALATSTTIGLKNGTKGGALFVANSSSAIMAAVLYPFMEKYGYQGPFVGLLGLFCGACGVAMFGVLIALSASIDRRRERLADKIIDRVAPETKE